MPLKIEIKDEREQWVTAGYVRRNDAPGSMSDNTNGERELYVFRCEFDDSKSTIYRSVGGIDREVMDLRTVSSLGLSVVRELSKGDAPYGITVKMDRSNKAREVRFTHE